MRHKCWQLSRHNIERENEKGGKIKAEEEENLQQQKSPAFLHTFMYWPEHTFLLNDFGKPLKKHIKGLCSAWAQLLLCFRSVFSALLSS